VFNMTGIVAVKEATMFSKARPWWMILEVDWSIMEYYRYWIAKQGEKTCPPLAKCHVSMVRGEEPRDKDYWQQVLGKKLKITYTNDLQTNGKHWWLPVTSPDILQVREELGLKPPKFQLHLTVATKAQ